MYGLFYQIGRSGRADFRGGGGFSTASTPQ